MCEVNKKGKDKSAEGERWLKRGMAGQHTQPFAALAMLAMLTATKQNTEERRV